MNQETNKICADIDTQLLSDFIYDLNISRRQLALYPENHPQIAASCAVVLDILKRLCQFKEQITLGVAPDALTYEGNWLDDRNPVYRDYARHLSGLDIASISFHRDLTGAELIRFNQTLRQDRQQLAEQGGIRSRLRRNGVERIDVTPVDYSLFQTGELDGRRAGNAAGDLWGAFLDGLVNDKLDHDGQAVDPAADAEALLARVLDRESAERPARPGDYDHLISRFVAEVKKQTSGTDIQRSFSQLVTELDPKVQRAFLNSAFQVLERDPAMTEEVLAAVPREILTEALTSRPAGHTDLSSRLLDLLGQLNPSDATGAIGRTPARTAAPGAEVLKQRIDVLLLEDSHDEYIPGDYQKTLSAILTGQVTGRIDPQAAQRLITDLDRRIIEKQYCSVLFNMLGARVTPDSERLIQDHLAELARFFLDTGDYVSLRDIFIRWSNYLYSAHSSARYLDEKVLADQTREDFMGEVLDSIALWGADKYDAICDYIREIGEPYAELLIERLAAEQQAERRKTWMKILVELGDKGHQIILKALDDERWFLVRNLLIVLGHQRDAVPMKAVYKMTGHPHPKVRQEAIAILFRHTPATAIRLLIKELSSPNKETLSSAVELARQSRDPQILNRLHQLLKNEVRSDDDLDLHRRLLETLAFHGQPDSVAVLTRLLDQRGFIRSRRQKEFQREIVQTLGLFPPYASRSPLRKIAADSDRTLSRLAREQLQRQQSDGRAR